MEPVFFEKVLLKFLFQDKEVREKVLPFLNAKIFEDFENKEIVKNILEFNNEFKKFPTIPDLKLHVEKKEIFERIKEIVELDLTEYSFDSLFKEIELFFKNKLVWNEITDAVEKIKDNKINNLNNFPDNLRTALAFTFDTEIGLDFLNEEDRLFDALHNRDKIISTGLPTLNKIIDGGVHEKTLTLFMGETNLGKTLVKCSLATNFLLLNKNVLYVTLEMSEEKISERIMANLFDVEINDLRNINRENFALKFKSIKKKIQNSLIIKEFPTRGINTNTLRNLLKELEIKKNFKPDVVCIDYLGIMNPNSELKSDNTYTIGKRISEELRGLAVEIGIPLLSSVQTNRSGFSSAEIDLKNTADSIGTTATGDIIIGITQPEEFVNTNKYCFIVLKNRFGFNKVKFVVSVNKLKMKVFETVYDNKNWKKPQSPDKIEKEIFDDATDLVTDLIKKDKKGKQNKIINFE